MRTYTFEDGSKHILAINWCRHKFGPSKNYLPESTWSWAYENKSIIFDKDEEYVLFMMYHDG